MEWNQVRERKKGLLIAPEFPYDSFWSYRYIMHFINKKAAFPPLGLLTFAADMPEYWDFKLLDLNVGAHSKGVLREEIAAADAVFVGAMSIQKRSLVDLLSGPAKGLDTPWVLGGPLASTYRDQILNPRAESDKILHDGLDLIVWGEAHNRIGEINSLLDSNPVHSPGQPILLIPETVANEQPGSRKYLNDKSIFKPVEQARPPRWDLINVKNYRALTLQTTLGCPFRCDFCDIIQFNGGFTRPKPLESVRRELEAIYATGHRGSVFTVDDNFVGNPNAISEILDVMTDFQRKHDYPFVFYTQASVDIGSPRLEYLITKMKRAGFNAVFLGIENPDRDALKGMNKKQNMLVDVPETVRKIQRAGIEVYAGFIFGADTDTPLTAKNIIRFVKDQGIFTAMTGMLTPLPHTPVYQRLKEEGRIVNVEFSGNNTDDEIQFKPKHMTQKEMRDGIHEILEALFHPAESYRRARDELKRVEPHIFTQDHFEPSYIKAALLSIWQLGIKRFDHNYFRLIKDALAMDWKEYQSARREAKNLSSLLADCRGQELIVPAKEPVSLFARYIDLAHDYLIRVMPEKSMQNISDYIRGIKERFNAGRVSSEDVQGIYETARNYLRAKMELCRFPGVHLVRAFELGVKSAHYERVMRSIVSQTSDA
jgi:radical SAM superfamily enzyme YgiQ (UPF0313 family)